MSLFGAVFAQNAWRCADHASYVLLLFTGALALVTFTVLPETQEARQRNLDVLACRPIPARTFLMARALSLGAMASLVGGTFGVVALAGGALRFPDARWAIPPLLLALLVQGFVVATLWVMFILFLVGRVSVTRVRQVSQTAFLLFVVASSLLSTGWLMGSARFDRAAHPWASWLPSSWFGRLLLSGGGQPALAERAAAIGLLLLALGAAFSSTLARRLGQQLELQAEAHADAVRRSWTAWLLETLASRPWSRRLLGEPSAALAVAIIRSGQREEVSRLRTLGLRVLAVVLFGMGLAVGRGFALGTLAYLVFSATLDALEAARQSADAPASWLVWKTPLRGAQVLRALELSVLLRAAALPLALAPALLFLRTAPPLAAALALGLALAGRASLAAALALWPSRPLAGEQRGAQSVLGLGIAILLTMGTVMVGGILILLADHALAVSLVLASLALAVLAAVTYGLRYLAGRRLDAVECPY